MTQFLPTVTALVLSAALAAAAFAKVTNWDLATEWALQLSRVPAGATVGTTVAAELAIVVLLATAPAAGFVASAVFLVAATAVLVRARDLRIGCTCFGRTTRVTARTFLRNAALLVVAAAGLVAGPPAAVPAVHAVLAIAATVAVATTLRPAGSVVRVTTTH